MNILTMKATALSLFALALISTSASANWPTVGGSSARHGQSPITGPNAAQILWQGTQSAWFGGQCYVEGDKLVLMRFQGLDYSPIVCHNLNSGAELWSIDFTGPASRSVPLGFRDGQVYGLNFQESQHDTVYALDPASGAILWRAAHTVAQGIIASAIFASDGDLILAGSNAQLIRVDRITGATVWAVNRPLPNTGAEALAAFGNKVYGWKGYINTPKELTAWNMDTGAELYSLALPGDGDQEIPHICGPDGTIYCKRDGGLLYAVTDNGSGLNILWSRSIASTGTYINFAVGLDGSVYVPDGLQLIRLDPSTGNELNRSPNLIGTAPLNCRIAVGANGTIYLGNAGYGDGAIYALSPDLNILWSDPVPTMVYGGPALGQGGALAVSGGGTTLKVYRTASDVTIVLTPVDPPIVIPQNGGSFNFNVALTNNSTAPRTFDAWIMVQLPSGAMWGPALGPISLTLPGYGTLVRVRAQSVPGSAPAGSYQCIGYAGDYPGTVGDSSYFAFTKSADLDGGVSVGNWANWGDPMGDEETAVSVPAPDGFELFTANPNPFNPSTVLSYRLPVASHVSLWVYDTDGRLVASLLDGWRDAGAHQITFDGSGLPSGIYFGKLEAGDISQVQKLILLK